MTNSIPFSQYFRIRSNCSLNEDFEKEAQKLRLRLKARGYSNSVLKRAYRKAKECSRSDLIFRGLKPCDTPTSHFITTYTRQSDDIRSILSKYWYVLTADPILSQYVSAFPSLTFRRARSLRDRLASSHLKPTSDLKHCKYLGTFKCGECP